MSPSSLYPLLLERKMVYRMWGGQRIARWLNLPAPHPSHTGETWEVYDTNRVRHGHLAGQTLAQVTSQYQEQLVGMRSLERYGADFPLLVKFIDANDNLSIQVHPDDAYAHAHEAHTGFHGKAECWYILEAYPEAQVIHGVNRLVTCEQFVSAVETCTLEQLVQYVPVQVGDVVFTPPGTLHAINHGILLYEIQQKSDLTYRVYDYGRQDPSTGQRRELHLNKALDVLCFAPSPMIRMPPVSLQAEPARTLLAACPYFALEHWSLSARYAGETSAETMELVTLIAGQSRLDWEGGSMELAMGDTVILPACLGSYALEPGQAGCRVLRVAIPDDPGQ